MKKPKDEQNGISIARFVRYCRNASGDRFSRQRHRWLQPFWGGNVEWSGLERFKYHADSKAEALGWI